MRSSKSRSRSKSNRNRSVGNIVNRVFDSSGPESKVRGTPQQIIEKYNQLARDAQLGNDRVAAENFQQHAEHYTRMLAEAQREQQERQQQNQQFGGGGGGNPQQQNDNRGHDSGHDGGQQNGGQQNGGGNNDQPRFEAGGSAPRREAAPEVIGTNDEQPDSGLVETPENRPQRQRKPRRRPAQADDGQESAPVVAETGTSDAAE